MSLETTAEFDPSWDGAVAFQEWEQGFSTAALLIAQGRRERGDQSAFDQFLRVYGQAADDTRPFAIRRAAATHERPRDGRMTKFRPFLLSFNPDSGHVFGVWHATEPITAGSNYMVASVDTATNTMQEWYVTESPLADGSVRLQLNEYPYWSVPVEEQGVGGVLAERALLLRTRQAEAAQEALILRTTGVEYHPRDSAVTLPLEPFDPLCYELERYDREVATVRGLGATAI